MNIKKIVFAINHNTSFWKKPSAITVFSLVSDSFLNEMIITRVFFYYDKLCRPLHKDILL